MDLHLIPGAEASADEREAVDAVLGAPASGWEGGARRPETEGHVARGGDAIRARRHMLLPALWAAQARAGWISPGALNYICQRLSVAPADAYGVATFYAMFSVEPQPPTIAHVCEDLACRLAGSKELAAGLSQRLPKDAVRPAPCLGLCERAPAVLFQCAGAGARDYVVAPADPEGPVSPLQRDESRAIRTGSPSAPQTLDSLRQSLRLLARVGLVDPESLDDYRAHGGYERNKPPFPVEKGLFQKPTVINNVETLVNVLPIVREGGAAFAAIGTAQSTGPKLFCLSGHVARSGVYEVEFGATLRQLIDLAGGVPGGRNVRAVLLGGAAGSFVGPAELDAPLTFEGTRAIGASLGSGVVMVFDEGADLADAVRRIAAFFRDEFCGQCVPCRIGAERQEELVTRIAAGRPLGSMPQEIALLDEMAQAMRDASICGLGQTASGAIQSAIQKLGVFGAKA
ncbi:MAG: NAD(P)H-dependent oxidoreductase subunit E [Thermoanaerobaculia bacterium]